MARKITIILRKGGSGKTTTAVNLATALHQLGKKTLLIDLEPQAHATINVGIETKELVRTISDVFRDSGIDAHELIKTTSFGLDVIPAHPTQLGEQTLTLTISQIGQLKAFLQGLNDQYDFIIIDTPPSEGFLAVAALVAADEVIVPLQAHFLALHGLEKALKELAIVKSGLNPTIKLLGILPLMVQDFTNLGKGILEELQNQYGDVLYPIYVKWSVKFSEADASHLPIVIQNPTHPGAQAYMNLARLLIGTPIYEQNNRYAEEEQPIGPIGSGAGTGTAESISDDSPASTTPTQAETITNQ
jgi:chromosome partitioning protein